MAEMRIFTLVQIEPFFSWNKYIFQYSSWRGCSRYGLRKKSSFTAFRAENLV